MTLSQTYIDGVEGFTSDEEKKITTALDLLNPPEGAMLSIDYTRYEVLHIIHQVSLITETCKKIYILKLKH